MSHQLIEAQCYRADSAYSESIVVELSGQGKLVFEFDGQQHSCLLVECDVSSRLGNTPRFIDLPNGLRLETSRNDVVDSAMTSLSHKDMTGHWLHSIERNIRWVLVLLVVVVLSVVGTYRYGIPAVAKATSPMVPNVVRAKASEQTLAQMDQLFLNETEFYSYERHHYEGLIQSALQPLVDRPITLLFRNSDAMGANAFALPDGTIVFTDQLTTQLTDDEFLAIAAHEIGHVLGDHGMRSVISSTSVVFVITLLTGNSEAISELLITAPTLLMQMTYSRSLESEADDYAKFLLNEADVNLENFATAMEKLLKSHGVEGEEASWMNYLSTHPEPHGRIAKFRQDTAADR